MSSDHRYRRDFIIILYFISLRDLSISMAISYIQRNTYLNSGQNQYRVKVPALFGSVSGLDLYLVLEPKRARAQREGIEN